MQIRILFFICLLIPALCLLTACGFHPVYGSHDSSGSPVAEQAGARLPSIIFLNGKGKLLRNELIDDPHVR